MSLQGKVAVVTGGSRGIGKAVSLLLAANGADVAVNYAGNQKAAEEVCSAISAMNRKAFSYKADVSDSVEVKEMFDSILKDFGRVDILVNNAGITRDNLLAFMKEDEWNAVVNANLTGMFNCTKAIVKMMMKQRSGRIINMTSVVGVNGNAGQANYAAAKGGVIAFTKSVAKELASRNITANAIAPGFIDTDMTAELSEKVKEEMLKNIPLRTLGQADDVARAVLFFASDNAKYITGQTLHVDGGMVM